MNELGLGINRLEDAFDYEMFLEKMRVKVEICKAGKQKIEKLDHIKLNYQRSLRLRKMYQVTGELKAVLQKINYPQWWIVLTEDWCGDSAQTLPYIAKMAELNDRIQLKILLRDQNIDIMEQYLTDGKRSIPKLIAFDESGRELFHWGPRPKLISERYKALEKGGFDRKYILEKLHLWYTQNRGKTLEAEILVLLKSCLKTHTRQNSEISSPEID